jgi:hypothetical protein
MNRSRPALAAARSVRGLSLAVPTVVAALVCGSSVFAIAAIGALALADGQPVAVAVSVPADPPGGYRVETPADRPPEAATGRVYSVAVLGPGSRPGDDPGPRLSPRVVAAGQPTVVILGVDPPQTPAVAASTAVAADTPGS